MHSDRWSRGMHLHKLDRWGRGILHFETQLSRKQHYMKMQPLTRKYSVSTVKMVELGST